MKIEMIPSYRIAFFRRVGPYGVDNVQTMEKLKRWAEAKDLLGDESVILGIAQDNPKVTKPEDCRYDTCLVISEDYGLNDESINHGQLAGGTYAVFVINHTAEAMQAAWSEIFSELDRRNYRVDQMSPVIERYTRNMLKDEKCEICVPIY